MKTTLQRIGNSQGVIIPKPLLAQVGFERDIEIEVDGETIVLSKPKANPRDGWRAASRAIARDGDDVLAWPEFANEDDVALTW